MTEPLAKDYATPDDYNAAHDEWEHEQPNRPALAYKSDRVRGDLDFNRIGLLLTVIKEAVLHGPSFTNIIAEANFELLDLNARALEFSTGRAKAKADAEAKARADELARTEELAKAEEDRLRKLRDDEADAKLKTAAQVAAAGQAKAEAEAKLRAEADVKAGKPVDPANDPSKLYPPDHVAEPVAAAKPEPYIGPDTANTSYTSDNGRRI